MLKAPVYVVEIHGFLFEANVCTSISLNPVASTAKIVPIKFSLGKYDVPEQLFRNEFEVG